MAVFEFEGILVVNSISSQLIKGYILTVPTSAVVVRAIEGFVGYSIIFVAVVVVITILSLDSSAWVWGIL